MTITWKIVAIDRDAEANRATTSHWRAEGIDGEFGGSIYGAISIQEYAKDTPYQTINEAMAIAWTKAALGKNAVEDAEKIIAQQIADAQAPKTETGTPWAPAASTTEI